MKIYFAGSIRGGREDKNLYREIMGILSEYGAVLTEHVGDINLTTAGEALDSREIYKRDMAWLTEADAVVAEVTTPSLGVGYEVAKAESMSKKILCIYRNADARKLSAMIDGSDSLMKKEYSRVEDLKNIFGEFFQK